VASIRHRDAKKYEASKRNSLSTVVFIGMSDVAMQVGRCP
jgi:hypothetical protein